MGRRRRARQLAFDFKEWGGARAGAGRKPKGERALVSHRRREPLASRYPVHVTMRLREGLPNLRRSGEIRAVCDAFRTGAERFGFRLNHYSVQTTHVHLIAEAPDRRALSRGLQGLAVRIARRLNRTWERKGKVFADHYHDRILRSPKEVRNALCYVLHNWRRHGIFASGVDPCSSGRWFDGWREAKPVALANAFVVKARTWLQTTGWRRWGLISLDEVPRGVGGGALRRPRRP
ncbi:MAG TPA: transposase [Planctomycetota bacterium]|nr:transposase [Planctomycetota bacterium]